MTDYYTVLNPEDASELHRTTSLDEAIAFAREMWFAYVYSYNLHRYIYDGINDEFLESEEEL